MDNNINTNIARNLNILRKYFLVIKCKSRQNIIKKIAIVFDSVILIKEFYNFQLRGIVKVVSFVSYIHVYLEIHITNAPQCNLSWDMGPYEFRKTKKGG